jgi:UDP-GlcNAc:undecaprenyl-phosphate/decaprenyl-phosphate GlcNAc-1-phosphate transferase
MIFLSTLLLSVFITLALIPLFRRAAVRVHALDMPNARKVHTHPIPRCGGVAMALGAVGPIVFWGQMSPELTAFLVGGAIVVAAGILDDTHGLGCQFKLLAQTAAAMFLVLYGGVVVKDLGNLLADGMLLPDWLATILTVFFLVGVTNAINLSDGLDGLAGGICLLIFLFISYLAYLAGNLTVAIIGLSIAGTLLGFLRFNTYPALLFMGDTGSMLLGYSAAALSIMLTQGHSPLSPLLPLILLGFPILDTLAVMAQRISEGRSPFAADKKHFHHRLLRLGLFSTEAVFSIYVIQCLLILFAWFFRFHSEWLLLLSYGIFCSGVVALFTLADREGWKLRRFDLVDRVIKGRLRVIREKRLGIRVSFRVLYLGLLVLFVSLDILARSIPSYLSQLSAVVAATFVLVWAFKKEWLGWVFMPCLYIYIPLLAYTGELNVADWVTPRLEMMHNISFVGLAFFAVATLKLTRRKGGFRMTPMDFIVVILAFAIMALPREILPEETMKKVIPEILVLFFGFEVLLGELRGKISTVAAATIAGLLVVAFRGIAGV